MRLLLKISTCLFISGFVLLTAFQQPASANEDKKHILFLKPGGSKILEIKNISKDIKVFISESDIVHARPLKEDQIYIRGKKAGYCTVTVWDKIKKEATAEIDVTVSYDLTGLKKQIAIHFPNQDIKVYGADNGIVLSGTVTGPEVVEQVIRLAERFLPTAEGGTSMVAAGEGGVALVKEEESSDSSDSETGKTKTSINRITNLLTVSNIQQVLLEVKIAEVTRDTSMNWSAGVSYFKAGSDFSGFAGIEKDGGTFIDWNNSRNGDDPSFVDASTVSGGAIITDFVGDVANLLLQVDNVGLALEFLEGEGLANTLAEPRLVALSGQEASFLAGGRFPYVTGTVDSDGNRVDQVEFEELGVSLKFTPIVQSNGLITLRVAPKISELDTTNPTITSGSGDRLPFVRTRQLETSAHLHDGQTLVLAGLLSDTMADTVNKIPLLGDLPVLGALFRSSAYQSKKTDLMITITPHLATPTKEGSISYPGEFIKPPNRAEFYLLGKLEGMRYADDPSRISGHNFSTQTSGGLEGSFGHIEK